MPKSATETPTAPTFDAVAPETIPAAVRAAGAEAIALGTAILWIVDNGDAAVDLGAHETRKDAVKRAATLKRAVSAVRPDAAITTRVYADGATFRVAILPKPAAQVEPTDEPTA